MTKNGNFSIASLQNLKNDVLQWKKQKVVTFGTYYVRHQEKNKQLPLCYGTNDTVPIKWDRVLRCPTSPSHHCCNKKPMDGVSMVVLVFPPLLGQYSTGLYCSRSSRRRACVNQTVP